MAFCLSINSRSLVLVRYSANWLKFKHKKSDMITLKCSNRIAFQSDMRRNDLLIKMRSTRQRKDRSGFKFKVKKRKSASHFWLTEINSQL